MVACCISGCCKEALRNSHVSTQLCSKVLDDSRSTNFDATEMAMPADSWRCTSIAFFYTKQLNLMSPSRVDSTIIFQVLLMVQLQAKDH
jgi:hypothetical protein